MEEIPLQKIKGELVVTSWVFISKVNTVTTVPYRIKLKIVLPGSLISSKNKFESFFTKQDCGSLTCKRFQQDQPYFLWLGSRKCHTPCRIFFV